MSIVIEDQATDLVEATAEDTADTIILDIVTNRMVVVETIEAVQDTDRITDKMDTTITKIITNKRGTDTHSRSCSHNHNHIIIIIIIIIIPHLIMRTEHIGSLIGEVHTILTVITIIDTTLIITIEGLRPRNRI